MTTKGKVMSISMVAANNVTRAKASITREAHKVTTGLRIAENRFDLASMSVSSSLQKDDVSVNQAMRNINDAISFFLVADDKYEDQYDILVEARELAVQNMNETYDSDQLANNSSEFNALIDEFDTIAKRAEYDGIALIDTATGDLTIQIGIDSNADSKLVIDFSNLVSNLSTYTDLDNVQTAGIATQSTAGDALAAIDKTLKFLDQRQALMGAYINRLESSLDRNTAFSEELQVSAARITDADMAATTSEMTRSEIMLNASTAALGQAKNIKSSTISLIGQ